MGRALGARCDFVTASALGNMDGIVGQQRVIELCHRLGADAYINATGGRALYDREDFERAGISLSFLRTTASPVPLDDGLHHLSILDALLHDGLPAARAQFPLYALEATQPWRMCQ